MPLKRSMLPLMFASFFDSEKNQKKKRRKRCSYSIFGSKSKQSIMGVPAQVFFFTCLNDDKDVKYGQKKLESCTEKKTFQVCHAVKRFLTPF